MTTKYELVNKIANELIDVAQDENLKRMRKELLLINASVGVLVRYINSIELESKDYEYFKISFICSLFSMLNDYYDDYVVSDKVMRYFNLIDNYENNEYLDYHIKAIIKTNFIELYK